MNIREELEEKIDNTKDLDEVKDLFYELSGHYIALEENLKIWKKKYAEQFEITGEYQRNFEERLEEKIEIRREKWLASLPPANTDNKEKYEKLVADYEKLEKEKETLEEEIQAHRNSCRSILNSLKLLDNDKDNKNIFLDPNKLALVLEKISEAEALKNIQVKHDTHIKSLETECDQVKKELADLMAKKGELEQKNGELVIKIAQIESEKKSLADKLEDSYKEIEKIEKEGRELFNTNNLLGNENNSLYTENEELKKANNAFKGDNGGLRSAVEGLTETVGKFQTDLNNEREKLIAEVNLKNNYWNNYDTEKTKREELEKNLQDVEGELKSKIAELVRLGISNDLMGNDRNLALQDLESLKQTVEIREDEIIRQREQITNQQGELESLKNELKGLKESLQELGIVNNEKKDTELRKWLTTFTDKTPEGVADELKAINVVKEQTEQKLATTQTELVEVQNNLKTWTDKFGTKSAEDIENELTTTNEAKTTAEQELNSRPTVSELQTVNEQLEQVKDQLKPWIEQFNDKSAADVSTALKESIDDLQTLQNELEKVRQEKEEIKESLDRANSQLREVEKNYKDLAETTNNLKNEFADLKKIEVSLQNQVKNLTAENVTLRNELTTAKKKITDLQKLSNTVQESFNEQLGELNTIVDGVTINSIDFITFKSLLDNNLRVKKERMNNLEAELVEKQSAITDLTNQKNETDKQLRELQEQLTEANKALTQLQESLNTIQVELDKVQKEKDLLNELPTKLAKTEKELKDSEEEKEKIKKAHEGANSIVADKDRQLQLLSDIVKFIRETETEDLKQIITTDPTTGELYLHNDNFVNLQDKINSIASLNNNINELNKQLTSAKDEIERLKTQLTTSQEEGQKLKDTITVLESNFENLQREKEAIEKTLNDAKLTLNEWIKHFGTKIPLQVLTELESAERAKNDLTIQLGAANTAQQEVEKQRDDAFNEKDHLQQKLIALQTKINELESEVAAANAAKADAEETTRLANQDKDTAENELTNLKHDLATNYFKRADLEREAANAGWQFTQADLDKAKAEAKQGLFTQEQLNAAKSGATVDPNTYILKTDTPALKEFGIKSLGLVDPTDYVKKDKYLADLAAINDEKNKVERDLLIRTNERDARPNITLAYWENAQRLFENARILEPVYQEFLDALKNQIGINVLNSNWKRTLSTKLGGKSFADFAATDSLATLLQAKDDLATEKATHLLAKQALILAHQSINSAASKAVDLHHKLRKFTSHLTDHKDATGEIDENKIKSYQDARDILTQLKHDPVMYRLIKVEFGKEVIDNVVLDGYKTAINGIGGATAVIAINTYKNKLQSLLNNPRINTEAHDNWQNHLKSLNDYNALNSQLQQAHQDIIAKERSILTTINDLGLELNSNELNLDKVLEKISELLNKPEKVLEEIKNDEIKTLPTLLPKSSKQTIITQISSAQTHQQLANIRNGLIKNNLDKSNNQLLRERTIFSILLVLSLLTIGILFMRTNKLSKKQKNSKLD